MSTGYLSDISVLLPYESGGQLRQLIEGALAATGVAVPNCKIVWVDKNNVKWVATDFPYSVYKVADNVATVMATFEMDYPFGGMCIDKNNTVWVVNPGSWCVQPFVNGVKGTAVGTSCLGNTNMPSNVCSDKEGTLWVIKRASAGANQVAKIVNKVVTANYTVEYGPQT